MTVPACLAATTLAMRPKVLAYIGNTTDTADATVYTFTGHAIGTPDVDRRVHVLVFGNFGNATTLVSVTVGGVAAEINTQVSADLTTVGIATAFVPTGTTADIVVTFSAAHGRANVGVYASTGLVSDTAHDTDTSTADPGTATLSTLSGGFALGIAGADTDTGTVTWTGLTENYDANPDAGATVSGASAVTTGAGVTPSADYSVVTSDSAAVFATF